MKKILLIFTFLLVIVPACAPVDLTPPPADGAQMAASATPVSLQLTPVFAEPAFPVEGSAGTFRLKIHPDLAGYTFSLIPNPDPYRLVDNMYMAGWVEATPDGAGEPVQKFPVEFQSADHAADWPQLGLKALDINFDGYLDIAAVEQGGAEWGFLHWYVFQPEDGTFKPTAVADQLSAIPNNGVAVDPAAKRILVYTLQGNCSSILVYRPAGDTLLLEASQDQDGCEGSP